MGVELLGKIGQTDPDLESDMPRKPTKKALLPIWVDFQGNTVSILKKIIDFTILATLKVFAVRS